MSGPRNPGKSLKARQGYDVGYAKPPKDTRFKPGQSGNPKGRPKGAKNKRPGLHEERLKDIIMDEAYRLISVKDGQRSIKMPVAKAAIRSIALNAAKGQHRAQRLFAELLAATENEHRMFNERWLETAIEYKLGWQKELERRERLGITHLPEPLPHPDHVEIDFIEGTARVIGPCTKEEKAALDDVIANKHILFEELGDTREAMEVTDDPKEQRRLQKLFDEQLEFICYIDRLSMKSGDM